MSKTKKGNVVFEQEVQCPNCKKFSTVKHVKNVVEEPVRGEYEHKIQVEPSKQSRLNDHDKVVEKKK